MPLRLSPATCVSNCSLTISALTGGNGWRRKQGVLEGGSSRHPFSSAVFREIPVLEARTIPAPSDCVGPEISSRHCLRSGPWSLRDDGTGPLRI